MRELWFEFWTKECIPGSSLVIGLHQVTCLLAKLLISISISLLCVGVGVVFLFFFQSHIQSTSDRIQFNDLQSLLCATLQVCSYSTPCMYTAPHYSPRLWLVLEDYFMCKAFIAAAKMHSGCFPKLTSPWFPDTPPFSFIAEHWAAYAIFNYVILTLALNAVWFSVS